VHPHVLIVADDAWARAGLGALLSDQPVEVVGQVGSEADWGAYQPDVVLLDLGMGSEGVELSEIPVLVLLNDPTEAVKVLAAGARGVLLRETEPEALAAAIGAVAGGLSVVEPELLNSLLPEPSPPAQPLSENLTERELEVLQLLGAGLPNKAIARRLKVSEHTAKFHVASILNKLGVQSRTEAVVRGAQLGLILL
jgi:DNA-binding NarL/FixJ family response regulator